MTGAVASDTRWGLEGVSVRLGGATVLDSIDLEVAAGRITAVVGGDGAGKSTLLRVVAGSRTPDHGRVRRPPPRALGAMLNGPTVYADLTVDENLAFVAAAYGLDGARWPERAAALVDSADLTPARSRVGWQLSGGMRNKLAVILALLPDPQLLVLDEPTTGVDPVSRAELWRLLADAAAAGVAVLISTTYLDEAERAATILVLDRGRTLLAGPVGTLLAGLQGQLADVDDLSALGDRPDAPAHAWRRGSGWRLWHQEGCRPAGAVPAQPSLEDVVVVAQLQREDGT